MSEPDSKKPQAAERDSVAGSDVDAPAARKARAPAEKSGARSPRSERASRLAEREAARARRAKLLERRRRLAKANGADDAGPSDEGASDAAEPRAPRRRADLESKAAESEGAVERPPEAPPNAKAPAQQPAVEPAQGELAGSTSRELRKSRARRLWYRLLFLVLLPTLAGAYYYYFQASPRFESVSLITIYSAESMPTATTSGLDALIGLGAGSSVITDGMSVREYVLSRDMLRKLDEEEGFIAHLRDPGKDWYTRLGKDASFEDAFSSYEEWVGVEVDPNSGVATLTVKAYSPEAAERFSRAIIRNAEMMVNDLSRRAREDQVRYAEDNVQKAEARLTAARQKLVEVQQDRGEYNPELSAQAQLSIRTALESQMASAKAELAQLLAYMTPDAPQVVGAREKVRSLAAQVAGASQKMVAKSENGQSLNKSVAEFEAVLVEKEFATSAYQATLTALVSARASASRQHRYLATIAPPSRADESTLPNRAVGVLTVFLCSLLLMGIGSLLVAGVKEHARL